MGQPSASPINSYNLFQILYRQLFSSHSIITGKLKTQQEYSVLLAPLSRSFHLAMGIKIVEDSTYLKYSQHYFVTFEDEEISTLVTSNPAGVKIWIGNVEGLNSCRLDRLIVGLDVEWLPNSGNPVATLQLCVSDMCLIFQILNAPRIPKALREFLEDPDYTFVGVGIKSDAKRLLNDYGLEVSNTRDLRSWAAKELGMKELRNAGLKDLAEEVLGIEIQKPKNITLSNWERDVLTRPQVAYACVDAYISFEIGRRLSSWY